MVTCPRRKLPTSVRGLKKALQGADGRITFLVGRVHALEEALKDELEVKSDHKKRIASLEGELIRLTNQKENAEQKAHDTRRLAAREGQKFLKADSCAIRYRGGIARLKEMATRAMKSAWTDSPSGGPSHELESLAGAIEALALMPRGAVDKLDRIDSEEMAEGFST